MRRETLTIEPQHRDYAAAVKKNDTGRLDNTHGVWSTKRNFELLFKFKPPRTPSGFFCARSRARRNSYIGYPASRTRAYLLLGRFPRTSRAGRLGRLNIDLQISTRAC
jgi:hypothetical protein